MKQLHSATLEIPIRKNQMHHYHQKPNNNPKLVLHLLSALATLTIIIFIPLFCYPSSILPSTTTTSTSSQEPLLPFSLSSPSSSTTTTTTQDGDDDVGEVSAVSLRSTSSENCDIFAGKWVWDPENAPYYTNLTCSAIHEHQNCAKYGKPNMDFTKWRWKPDGCEMPLFNPELFLKIVRGKSLAFVGDSIARNQMQSLICLLSKVDDPVDVSNSPNPQLKRYFYTNYNFTIAILWSPYLVKTKQTGPNSPGLFDLYLDEFDDEWTSQIDKFDYLIISAGQWFFRPSMFYVKDELIGCLYCKDEINITHFGLTYGYRRAFKTMFRAINSLGKFKGMTFLRTFTPSHFENGLWNEGGNCTRTRPFMSNETSLNGENLEMYVTQVEEFRVAEKEGMKKGLKFRLLDTSHAMWLRPDGHPDRHWHGPEDTSKYNDCVHWCLPGPIDSWNEFLLEILKRED